MNHIDCNFVQKYVESWESRHDGWVKDFLGKAIGSNHQTFQGVRLDLKKRLEDDWHISLGFLIERTTYQSRKDILNIRTANYLFQKMCSLPLVYSEESLKDIIQQIRQEKESGQVTHIRVDKDIKRLKSVAKFIINSKDKNITKVVLAKIDAKMDASKFLGQFHCIGPKTASFYLKFIAWIFDLSIEPIVIDTHVMTTLHRAGRIAQRNPEEARNAIVQLSRELGLSPIKIETALYEASWLSSNRPTSHPTGRATSPGSCGGIL